MSDEQSIDAESSARNRSYGAPEHLQHLLRIGYRPDSEVIRHFVADNHLDAELEALLAARDEAN